MESTDLSQGLRDLVPVVTSLIQREFAKFYVNGIKNLRITAITLFFIGVLASSVFLGIILLVGGIMVHVGASASDLATAAIILGGLLVGFVLIALNITFKEKFWFRTFKIEDVVEGAIHKPEKVVPEAGSPRE